MVSACLFIYLFIYLFRPAHAAIVQCILKRATIGLPAKRFLNFILLTGRRWPEIVSWLGCRIIAKSIFKCMSVQLCRGLVV